jgi:hypothetical protein
VETASPCGIRHHIRVNVGVGVGTLGHVQVDRFTRRPTTTHQVHDLARLVIVLVGLDARTSRGIDTNRQHHPITQQRVAFGRIGNAAIAAARGD